MKAAVIRGTQKIVVEDIPTPEPGSNQVLVKIKYSALCGSDVHRFQYGMANDGSVLGHEYIGEVVQTGRDVTMLSEGDRVISGGGEPPGGTGSTLFSGERYSARTVGLEATRIGGFAEYVAMDEWRPLLIPDGVSDELAVLAEPASIAVHAVRTSAFKIGDQAYFAQHMSHPTIPKGNTYSAYRDYGRFGAYFVTTIPKGESLRLRYRILVGAGEMPERGFFATQYGAFVK